ncbi:MAG: type II toxin-antitoxin system VapC family toxin [Polymorphobacter sp.]
MLAIDTNILVRLIARDDAAQVALAEALVSAPFLLLPTVLLETEWVLRARYTLPRERIADGFAIIAGLPTATVVSARAVAHAIARWRDGGDFADHLHQALAAETDATGFATFDRKLAGAAGAPLQVTLL